MANTANIKAVITAEDKASGAISKVGDNIAGTAKNIGLALTGAGVGLTLLAKNATDFTTDLARNTKILSRETGATIEQSSGLLYVTDRLGVSAEEASRSFGIFSKKIVESNSKTGESAQAQAELASKIEKTKFEIAQTTDEIKKHGDKTGELGIKLRGLQTELSGLELNLKNTGDKFSELGIKTKDATGNQRSFNDILLDTADKFKAMPDGVEKTALAMELFGRSGKDMLPVLNLGAKGIQDLEKRADELGLTLNAKTIGSVNRYIESQKNLKDSTNAMKVEIGNLTAPVLTNFNNKINEVIFSLLRTDGPMKTITTNVLAFGGPVLTAAGGALSLGASITQIGTAGFATAAKLGGLSIIISSIAAGFAYLGKSVYDTASNTGSASQAMSTWQANALTALPLIGSFASSTLALTGQLNASKDAQDRVKAATDATKLSQTEATLASDMLKDASLRQTGANLAVEQAQLAYNSAVAQYGPNSLQARQAHHQLEQANRGVEQANKDVKKAAEDKANKERELAKNKDAENAAKSQASAINSEAGAFDRLSSAIGGAIRKLSEFAEKATTSGGKMKAIPFFAGGVQDFAGGAAIVGEKGPELINLPKGSDVIPANQTRSMLSSPMAGLSGPTGSSSINVSFNGVFTGNEQEFRQLAIKVFQAGADAAGMLNSDLSTMTSQQWRRI